MFTFNQAEKDIVLAQESRRRRNAGKRKQKQQHQYSLDWRALVEPGHIVDLVADYIALPQRSYHRERTEIQERIDKQVDHYSLETIDKSRSGRLGGPHSHKGQEHVPNVSNRRISEQAFGVR